MNTLYISDLDGTLLNSHAELSAYTIDVLNRLIANGMHFSIATARTAATALMMLENVELNIPIILMNGVLVYDFKGKEYIKKEILSDTAFTNIIHVMQEMGQSGLIYTLCGDEMKTYYETRSNKPLHDFINEREVKYNKIFIQVDDFSSVADDIIYFCFLDEQENIERLYSSIVKTEGVGIVKYCDIYSENLWYLEVFSSSASKYNAVQFLRENGRYEQIIGFGDNLNDIPLFRACDECYAVANAKDELKEIANAVIESNENDGVAKYLEQFAK